MALCLWGAAIILASPSPAETEVPLLTAEKEGQGQGGQAAAGAMTQARDWWSGLGLGAVEVGNRQFHLLVKFNICIKCQ